MVILPVATISPTVPKLPTLALPEAFNVPVTLTPVPETTTIFALPTALIVTLPFALGIDTLLLPLAIDDPPDNTSYDISPVVAL